MLIWKTQTLNVNVASVRYRCLLPLRYLAKGGVHQTICGGADPVKITPQTEAIVFVKSFRNQDIDTCKQAKRLGVPIILDLCDNIFIEEYALGKDYVPADNFRSMVQQAAAIVTTGEALKKEIERAIAPLNASIPIVIIPDGNETLSDIDEAFRITRVQRLISLVLRPATKRLTKPFRRTYAAISRLRAKMRKAIRQRYKELRLTERQKLRYKREKREQREAREKQEALQHGSDMSDVSVQEESIQSEPSTLEHPPSTCSRLEREASTYAAIAHPKVPPKVCAKVQPTPFSPDSWPAATPGTKTILWFGNHGAKYGSFGMSSILDTATAIETISREQSIRLVVVSNSRDKYEQFIQPLPFKTHYLRWHPRAIYSYIQASDVVIIPNSQSVYSICKSANRAVLALSQGTPVVASCTPALALFEGCVVLDDWEKGLRQYLLDPEISQTHVALAQQAIARNLSGDKIAQQWLALIEDVTGRSQIKPFSTKTRRMAGASTEQGSQV